MRQKKINILLTVLKFDIILKNYSSAQLEYFKLKDQADKLGKTFDRKLILINGLLTELYKHQYSEAIEIYSELTKNNYDYNFYRLFDKKNSILSNNFLALDDTSEVFFFIGRCYYKLNDYENGNEYFKKYIISSTKKFYKKNIEKLKKQQKSF